MMFDILNRRRVADLEKRLSRAIEICEELHENGQKMAVVALKLGAKLRLVESQRRAAAAKGRASQAAKRLAKLHQHNEDMRASMGRVSL